MKDLPIHIVIGDTQVRRGVPINHLDWIGRYVLKFAGRPVRLVHLGDHADMSALSSYDRGKRAMENRRVKDDFDAANEAFDILNAPLIAYNDHKRRMKEAQWWPDRHITLGNHEDRITRAVEDNPQLEGLLGLDGLNFSAHGWQVHDYLKPVFLDGVGYAHYWANRMTGKAMGGYPITRLKSLGHSFTMGHQQTKDYAERFVLTEDGYRSQHGLIVGATYLHDEDYKGPQGNAHWRGIVVCHGVEAGEYDPMFVRLDYLCRRYEEMSLRDFMASDRVRYL